MKTSQSPIGAALIIIWCARVLAAAILLQTLFFTVIELNGLSSDATNIYETRHSVRFGWRKLCRQWELAFASEAENRARSAKPFRLREVWRLFVSHKEAA